MIRLLSRTVVPAVAATILAALYAQSALAASPTVTHSSISAADPGLGAQATTTCGIGTITAVAHSRSTTVRFPMPAGDGRISTETYAQRIVFTHAGSGARVTLSLAGVATTYRNGGALYVRIAGRSLNQGSNGLVIFRNGVELSRSGRPLDLASAVCARFAAGPGASRMNGTASRGAADAHASPAAHGGSASTAGDRVAATAHGRSAAARAAARAAALAAAATR